MHDISDDITKYRVVQNTMSLITVIQKVPQRCWP